jgi:YhcN/YlaJ family sporulation lipoprotein
LAKILLMAAFIFLTTGCMPDPSKDAQDPINQNVTEVNDSANDEKNRGTNEKIAAGLVDIADDEPKVNNATAVVMGDYALVGIDINKNVKPSEANKIKKSVSNALKNHPYGENAVVISDPDLNARLEKLSEDIQRGEPKKGILKELADIANAAVR